MSCSFQSIPFAKINFNDKWNIHPWDEEPYPEDLVHSIHRIGIIHPPYLVQRTDRDSNFDIVTGYKRLKIAKHQLKKSNVGCFIVPEQHPKASILDLILTDQLAAGSTLTVAEKSCFLLLANKYLTAGQIVKLFLKRLELRVHETTIAQMLAILDFDSEIIKEIHKGHLQLKMIAELQRIKRPQDRSALITLFKTLSLGAGKQRKIFSLVRDLAYRSNSSISELLKITDIQQILNHTEMNTPQKAQHLGNYLQKKLVPAYTEAENNFNNFSKELKLSKNLALSHSQSFETDEITLSVVFHNLNQCQALLPKIKSLLESEKK